jgi:hypothetical protein
MRPGLLRLAEEKLSERGEAPGFVCDGTLGWFGFCDGFVDSGFDTCELARLVVADHPVSLEDEQDWLDDELELA